MRLTWLQKRLNQTGPDDMRALLGKVQIEQAARVVYGIGTKTVSALREQGYCTAADLWDEDDDEARVPKVPLMGESRQWALENWVSDQARMCEEAARANAARRAALEKSIREAEADLAASRAHAASGESGAK